MPDRGHAAHNSGAHQHQHKRAVRGLKHTHHALVAGKQARHTPGGGRINRKKLAGHINHATQTALHRHVDAVVVLGTQVKRGKTAAVKAGGQRGIAPDQRGAGIAVAFGLKNLITHHRSKLADGTIHRTHQVSRGQRAGIASERAGEKVVERGVA